MGKHRLSILLLAVLATCAAGTIWGQSNEVIDSILAEEQATLARAAYLVMTASGAVEETQSVEQAFAALQAKPWGFASAAADDKVTLGSYAYLVMRAFGMRGGVLYSIFPGKRYAAREFVYRDFIQGNGAPGRILTGREVTHVLGRVLDALGQRSEETAAGEVAQ
jgi:hypothetical protein